MPRQVDHVIGVRVLPAGSAEKVRLPFDTGNVIYSYTYDSQVAIDDHFHSAGDGDSPVYNQDSTGGFARWWITDKTVFGRVPSPQLDVPETGIVDVDFAVRLPKSWFHLGTLPMREPTEPGGDFMTFPAMKLFRCFPIDSGHNATLFGRMRQKTVYLRDFANDKATPAVQYSPIPDRWTVYRIRYDYASTLVELYVWLNGVWSRISSAPGGIGDKIGRVGPIFHATARQATKPGGYGKHPPAWVDYHSYRVIHRS